jgi:hypothetical protein
MSADHNIATAIVFHAKALTGSKLAGSTVRGNRDGCGGNLSEAAHDKSRPISQ